MSDKKQGVIQIQEGTLVVSVDLTQPNAEIISLGILEKAKDASKVWIFQNRKLASPIVKPVIGIHVTGGPNGI